MFDMATQGLLLIHPHELEVLRKEDFITMQEKVTAEDTAVENAMDIAKDNAEINALGKLTERES